jgi:ribulose bisphosphate carboxylase small subunit
VTKPTPDDYALIFETNKVGAAIFEELIQRFSHTKKADGIDRICNAFEEKGRREVLDFIVLRINQANGVEPTDNEVTTDED